MGFITATFKTRRAAEEALERMEDLGVTSEQISLLVTDSTRGNSFHLKEGSKVDEGAAAGASAGGLIGTILGAIAAAGSIAVPGLNLVITGALASALAGLGTGALAGGLIGGLIGAGIPEHEAKIYEDEIKEGAILLAVRPESDAQKDKIESILRRCDAYNLAA